MRYWSESLDRSATIFGRFGLLLALLAGSAAAYAQTPFKADGFAGDHPIHSLTPNEHVDPVSGNLLVTATDLALPGPIPLAVTRIYSSQVFPDFENGQSTALEDDNWAGLGWSLHWGRILHTELTGPGQTVVELPGGGGGPLYSTAAYSEGWMTKGFARYNRTTNELKLPNGLIYTFNQSTITPRGGTVRYVTEIRDVYNNRITFAYFGGSGPADGVQMIRQYTTSTQYRELTFTYDAILKSLASLAYNGRTWTYTQDAAGAAGHSQLRSVQPPVGRDWDYAYTSGYTGELTQIITPAAGRLDYTYATVTRYAASTTRPARVVVTRNSLGHAIVNNGWWTFTYSGGSNKDESVIVSPCGGTTRYRFYGTGLAGDFSAWLSGALRERKIEEAGTVLETETPEYIKSEAISYDSVPGQGGLWSDADVFTALLSRTTTIRQGVSWWTDYDYHWGQGHFNDYGSAYRTTAQGERQRIVTRTFQTGFTPHILGRLASQTTQVGAQTITSTWTYELATGFLTRADELTRTDYERNARGQVSAVIDGLGNRTTLTYDWGVVSQTQTPLVTSTRVINQDGSVASESLDTLVTTYQYDALGRLNLVDPPGAAAPTSYSWDGWGYWVEVSQDTARTHINLDGFGRPWSTEDNVGVKTWREYDTCGRVIFQSAPYTTGTGTRGATTTYDALNRVKTVTGPDGSVATTTYQAGNNFVQTDALGRQTTYSYTAAGHPDGGVLASVKDPNNVTTTYAYDVFDHVVTVSLPGVPDRQWIYDGRGLLLEDRQPESGNTLYQYDAAANRTRVTNANGEVLILAYDGNNRLISRDAAPGTIADVTITYNSLGQVTSRQAAGGTTSFTYNTAGRVATRTDTRGALSWTSSYGYDVRGNVTSITYPSGRLVTYEYDMESRLMAVRMNGALFASGFTYDDSGRLTTWVTGGVTHTRNYDTRDRTERIRALGPNGGLDVTYAYNAGSHVLSIADPRPGMNQSFMYDALDRLTRAAGPWGQLDWAYDAAGNRLWERRGIVTTFTYNQATQRLTSAGGGWAESFGYDAIGQLTSDGRGTYTYSPAGRMLTATTPTASATYGYDADDLRIARTVNGVTAYTVRGAAGQTLSEYQQACAGSVWARDLIYAGGALIGAARAVSTLPTVSVTTTAANVAEAVTTASVGVQLSTGGGASTCAVSVSWEALAATTAPGADFVAAAGTITFPAGTANGAVQQVGLTLLPDALDEDDETLMVALTSAFGGQVGAANGTTFTILDDDPTPVLSVTSATVAEPDTGSVAAVLTATLSNASGRTVTATFATANGTATAGSDFTTVNGTLTFDPGMTSQTLSLEVLGDLVAEANETFSVALSNVQNATWAGASPTVTITDNDQVAVTLVANRTFPISAGTSVTWTASTTKGSPPYEYLFRLTQHSTGVVRTVQGYAGLTTFTWIPATPGSYTMEVRVRPVGSGVAYEATAALGPFTITAAPAVTTSALTASYASPVQGGTTVTWTATATGGVGPLQYQFRVYDTATATWTVFRDFAPSASAPWATLGPGTFTIEVRVRSAGSAAAYEAFRQVTGFTVTLSGMNPVSLTPNQVFPVAVGTPVTWTAKIASGTQPAQYQFLWRPTGSSTWTVGRAYSASPVWTWSPASAGTYNVQVWGRETWFPGEYETYIQTGSLSVTTGPIGSVGLSASQSVPVTAGMPITWTATATGGTAPLQYQFWLRDAQTELWSMVRDYSADRTWTWTPGATAFGQVAVQVYIRNTGSAAVYEAYYGSGYFAVTP